MKLKVLDLFSGIGGFSLGLESTGYFETAAFCEIDPKAREVLAKNFPGTPIFNDVNTLRSDDIGHIDVICGGFPCQDISNAGRGEGLSGARSGLWYQYLRIIREVGPRFAVIENVAALRTNGLETILCGLTEIGYDAEWHCIPASAVGAPHQRDRIWILAYPMLCRCDDGPDNRGGRHLCTDTQRDAATPLPNWEQSEPDARQTGPVLTPRALTSHKRAGDSSRWATEPGIRRVVNGFPARVDRVRQLGNAVVPQIPAMIGRAIAAAA